MSLIQNLPDELLLIIIDQLDDRSALRLSSTCRDLEARIRDDIIRRDLKNDGVILMYSAWNGCLTTLVSALELAGGFAVRQRLNKPLSIQTLQDRVLGANYTTQLDVDPATTYALNLACWNGHRSIVETLLALGAKVDAVDDNNNNTALHHALDPECARMLVEAGAEINASGELGMTPLTSLIDSASSYLGPDSPFYHLPIPARFSYPGFLDTVRYLADRAGADVNLGPDNFLRPMGRAASACMPEVMQILLRRGAAIPPDMGDPGESFMEGVGALLRREEADPLWTQTGALLVLDLLVAAGADTVDAIHAVAGNWHDAQDSFARAVAYRAVAGCSDLEVLNSSGETPLEVATKLRHDHVAEMLVSHGADLAGLKAWYASLGVSGQVEQLCAEPVCCGRLETTGMVSDVLRSERDVAESDGEFYDMTMDVD